MKIAVDLNGVIRNFNKQINVCYQKATGSFFVKEDTENEHNIKDELEFPSIQERNSFYFENYPFELYGCAPCMSNLCTVALGEWMKNAYNFIDESNEEEKISFMCVSPYENALSIKATYFFLSKFLFFRETYFPEHDADIWDKCDVVITSNPKLIKSKPDCCVSVLINNKFNEEVKDIADFNYDNIELLISDDYDFSKLYAKYNENKKNGKKSPIFL